MKPTKTAEGLLNNLEYSRVYLASGRMHRSDSGLTEQTASLSSLTGGGDMLLGFGGRTGGISSCSKPSSSALGGRGGGGRSDSEKVIWAAVQRERETIQWCALIRTTRTLSCGADDGAEGGSEGGEVESISGEIPLSGSGSSSSSSPKMKSW